MRNFTREKNSSDSGLLTLRCLRNAIFHHQKENMDCPQAVHIICYNVLYDSSESNSQGDQMIVAEILDRDKRVVKADIGAADVYKVHTDPDGELLEYVGAVVS